MLNILFRTDVCVNFTHLMIKILFSHLIYITDGTLGFVCVCVCVNLDPSFLTVFIKRMSY